MFDSTRSSILDDHNGYDEVPLLSPIACGRKGEKVEIVVEPIFGRLLEKVTDCLSNAHDRRFGWSDIAVLVRYNK
jgi:hypothetical protein